MLSIRQLGVVAAAVASWVAMPAFGQVEEIIVTATRREESIQSVPVSITALSAERLETARIEGVRDLALMTPSLNMNARSNAWIPYIRGVGAQDTSGGQEASVSIYIDGVYMSSVHAGALSFNNVDRVEVLKGPQGTLFGRNSTGGLINVITRDPSQEFEVFGKVGYGNFETKSAQLYVGGGVMDGLAADIALNYTDQGKGYGRNLFKDERLVGDEDEGARTKWIWTPTENTKVTWTADWQKHRSGQGDNRSLIPGSVGADGSVHVGGYQDVNFNFPEDGKVDGWVKNMGTMLKVQHSFSAVDFVSISAYRKIKQWNIFDNDGLPGSFVEAIQDFNRTTTFTQEFQLLSRDTDSKFNWIVGLFYLDDKSGYRDPIGLNLRGLQVTGDDTGFVTASFVDPIKTTSIAGFAEGTYHFSDRTRLTLGARYTRDKKELGGESRVYVGGNLVGPADPLSPYDFEKTWKKPTFKIALEQDVATDAMLYATYNRGFRSGSFNTVGVTGVPVDPEIIDAYEVGIKSQWLDNRLRVNAAAYFYDFKDLQVVVSRGPSTDLINAAKAEIKGLELDLEGSLTERLSVRAGASYIDSEYTDFETGTLCSIRLPDGHTMNAPPCSPKGNELTRTPEFTFNLGVTYRQPVSFGFLGASLDYKWTDEFFWEIDNRLVEPSYGVLNGQVSWESLDEHWGVTLWGRNITDEEYAMFRVSQASCGAICAVNPFGVGDQYSPAPPRTYGVEVNFKF
jgi:iron complex outermembrane receptor protein